MKKKIITSDDILGKDAIDPDGQILGVITKLHIDKNSKKMIGITIDEGFMKPELFIGLNYIKNFGIDSVFISRIPTEKYIGLRILNSKGKEVGKVRKVVSKRHKVKAIEIGKDKIISASDIQEIGESIILKEKYKIQEK
ncbi:PRC-barrel domain-containing protein [Candidatus Woesearchaeota archaeon]|nr:PRC-barrel domain-containing protein [Candidatus Woesearchaeota archaeon]